MHYFALLLLLAGFGPADKIDYQTAHLSRTLRSVRTTDAITIDGRLEERAWASAPFANDFLQTEPREGEAASEPTEVRVLYDNENVYFGIRAQDSQAKSLVVSDLKKDFNANEGDYFELILDTFHDRRNGYQFAINPAGARWDAQMINEGREVNSSWDGIWYVKTHVEEDAWYAEIAIPFKALKFRNSDVQTWGNQLSPQRSQQCSKRGQLLVSDPAHLQHPARVDRRNARGTRRRPARSELTLQAIHHQQLCRKRRA